MHDEVRARIAAIAADRERGASELARLAIEALSRAVELSTATTVEMLRNDIAEVAVALATVRPTMVVIANWVGRFQHRQMADLPTDIGVDKLCGLAQALRFVLAMTACSVGDDARQAAQQAAAFIARGVRSTRYPGVVTCSYSSTVLATLVQAQKEINALHCHVAESNIGDRSYGWKLAAKLKERRVATTIVADTDKAIAMAIDWAQLAIIGADAVLGDGAVLNGVPSLRLAQAAKAAGIPLYVVAEGAKFTTSHIEPEAGFEHVPAEFIKGIITEDGVVAPSSAAEVAQRWR